MKWVSGVEAGCNALSRIQTDLRALVVTQSGKKIINIKYRTSPGSITACCGALTFWRFLEAAKSVSGSKPKGKK